MGRVQNKVNHRIEVHLPHPGDFGFCFVSSVTRTEEETFDLLSQIRDQIIRHVDGVSRNSVNLMVDVESVCEHCGSAWTEGKDSPHNGGCCEKDCEVFDKLQPQQT